MNSLKSVFICSHKKVLLWLILVFPPTLIAQNARIDSLEAVLNGYDRQDSAKVDLLNQIVFDLQRKDVLRASELVKKSREIAHKIDYKKGKAESFYLAGVLHIIQSDFEQAVICFDSAKRYFELLKHQQSISKCLNGIGVAYHHQGKYDLSLANHKQSLQVGQETKDREGITKSLNNIGMIYSETGDHEKALEYYNKSLEVARKLGNVEKIAICLNNLGTVHINLGDYYRALESYNQSLILKRQLNDVQGISNSLNNIGVVYKKLGYLDEALDYYQEFLSTSRSSHNKKNVASALNNIGSLHFELEDYVSSAKYFEDALNLSEKINDKKGASRCLYNLGKIKDTMGEYALALKLYEKAKRIALDTDDRQGLCESFLGMGGVYLRQKKYDNALKHLWISRSIADSLGLVESQRDIQELLSQLYAEKGDFEKAYQVHFKFKALSDSLFNQEKLQKIAQLQYEYKYKGKLDSAKRKEIKLINEVKTTNNNLAKTQKQKLLTIIGFLLLTLVLGSIIFSLRLHHIRSLNQNILVEQKLLRSQMTPHFIFNSLSVLQGIILNKEYKKSITYLSRFSKLLRIILENSRDKLVLLESELKAIENYLVIQNLGVDIPYQYSLSIDHTIDKNRILIPPMLIQPFVENAIEHGFSTHEKDKKLSVSLKFHEQDLVCSISDNGVGIDFHKQNGKDHKKSLSTTITAERLQMLSKEFDMRTNIKVEDRRHFKEKGTMVTLVLPYKLTTGD